MGPTVADLQRIAADAGLGLDDSELAICQQLIEYGAAPFAQLAAAEAVAPSGERPQPQGPDPEEAPRGAWASRTEIAGAASGELAGKRMAIKDNIAVAGMPLTVGTKMLEGVVAPSDATVVTRALDAGATILGTATCEALTMSGGSHTSDTAVVGNPYDETRTPGGSSTGCAALLAAGAVEMALATDVAGSVRIPASWSGLSALKPTYGLVPYSGGFPASPSLDHIGPMARTVAGVADLLAVIAGPDGRDPRQGAAAPLGELGAALDGGVEGLRIGVLREGFGLPGLSEPEVDESVTAASKALAELGAAVSEVSVAEHGPAAQLWNVVAVTEGAEVFGAGADGRWAGYYDPALVELYAAARDRRAAELPDTVKAMLLMGLYVRDSFGDGAHAIAQARRPLIRQAYDRALAEVDLLLLPTTPQRATEIPAAQTPLPMRFMAGVEMTANTCPFNLTGHPALSVPCGMAGGLPIGMMLVGRHDEDATVLRAGDAYQRQVFSPPSP